MDENLKNLCVVGNKNKDKVREYISNNTVDLNSQDNLGYTLLHWSIMNKDIVEVLLKNDARVNKKENKGKTPLHMACSDIRLKETVNLLLDEKAGAQMDIKDNEGKTPLHLACEIGFAEVVGTLLAKGVKVNIKDNQGYTPLHLACNVGSDKVVQLLLAKGAKVNIGDEKGRTPLHLACGFGFVKVAELLVDKGANVNIGDNIKQTPLHLACGEEFAESNGRDEVVEFLLSERANADVNSQDIDGSTPLHLACSRYCESEDYDKVAEIKVVNLLLSVKDIDINIMDNKGWRPINYAYRFGCIGIAKLLIRKNPIYEDKTHWVRSKSPVISSSNSPKKSSSKSPKKKRIFSNARLDVSVNVSVNLLQVHLQQMVGVVLYPPSFVAEKLIKRRHIVE